MESKQWETRKQQLRKLFGRLAFPGWFATLWKIIWKVVGWFGNYEFVRDHAPWVERVARTVNPPHVGTAIVVVGILWLLVAVLFGDALARFRPWKVLVAASVSMIAVAGIWVACSALLHQPAGQRISQNGETGGSGAASAIHSGTAGAPQAGLQNSTAARPTTAHKKAAKPNKANAKPTEQAADPTPTGGVGIRLGPGTLVSHSRIQGRIICDKQDDCQNVAVTNNRIDANAALENSGTIGKAEVSGNYVRPSGGAAEGVKNNAGAHIDELKDTQNDIGPSLTPRIYEQKCDGSACAQGPGSQATYNQYGPPPLKLTASLQTVASDKEGLMKTAITVTPNQPVTAPSAVEIEFDNPITGITAAVAGTDTTTLTGRLPRIGKHAMVPVADGFNAQHSLIVFVYSEQPVKVLGDPHLE
jgi:hypothetical protein